MERRAACAHVITRGPDGAPMSPRAKPATPPAPEPDPGQSPVRQAAERAYAKAGSSMPIDLSPAQAMPPLKAGLTLRFGLTAWSNAHFDNALFPIGTPHDEYLPRYSSVFSVAEADQLYHRLPGAKLLEPWIEQTPKGFKFLPKMWKKVT